MDYSKIRLKNERNSHVVKRLNRLSAWGFFKVLYRENVWRLLGFSMLMVICIAPIILMQMYGNLKLTELRQTLPNLNSFGFSSGVWTGVGEYYAQQVAQNNLTYGLLTVAVSLVTALVVSGGFAVIRDSFWTGKLSAVGVFKSMGKGIKANIGYAVVSVIVAAFGIFGIIMFYTWAATAMPVWLAIVLTVLLSLAFAIVVCYLLILCSVSVTYQQSIYENLDDSWRLLWLNFLPNIIHLIIALLPIPLYFLFSTSMLQFLFVAMLLAFGGMYFPLVWQTHMMKTFALFHPVEVRKKKDVQREEQERAMKEAQLRAAAEEAAQAKREARKKQNKKPTAKVVKQQKPQNLSDQTEQTADNWDNAYEVSGDQEGENAYGIEDTEN